VRLAPKKRKYKQGCVTDNTREQAAQQFRKDDCLALSHEVGMLKKFGKHPYLPQFHGVAKDDEGTLHAV
jgi:hypothetical protein